MGLRPRRWLDARKVWGGILNRSRDIVRQARASNLLGSSPGACALHDSTWQVNAVRIPPLPGRQCRVKLGALGERGI